MPLIFEAGAAAAIAVTTASPIGEPERATGRWLPFLRLATALALTAAAQARWPPPGPARTWPAAPLDVLRNVAGMTGIGLLCAAALGGGLAWAGPLGYLVVGAYGLYTQWHGPALTTPWIWPARPPHDLGAAVCAALVFAIGIAVITRARSPRSRRRMKVLRLRSPEVRPDGQPAPEVIGASIGRVKQSVLPRLGVLALIWGSSFLWIKLADRGLPR